VDQGYDLLQGKRTRIDFDMKIAIRFENENRSLIFPERFSIAIMMAIVIRKSDLI
jgi:hypothetical protein